MSTLSTTNLKNPSSASNNIVLDSSGRVLVGTSTARSNVYYTTVATTPAVQFETVGSSYSNGLSLINYSNTGYAPVLTLGSSSSATQGTQVALSNSFEMGAIQFAGSDGTNFRTGATIVATNDQAASWAVGDCPTRLVFSTTADGASSPTERMRITSNGDLLVGTTGAGGRLAVASASAIVSPIATTSVTGDTIYQAILVTKFDNNTTTSQNFIQFQVNNGGANCGRITANGANTAAFGSTSDIRLKENIADLPPQLQNILSLRPVEFDYIESEGGGHQIGFIAQEMQAVYPDVVNERGEDDMLMITGWSKTEARLVKAIQEQQAIIKGLEDRLAALEAQ